ncbi:hypothetical protein EVAR_50067_1 [Eumeta japonica]|uniref:Uncharacterized protein n=1 Tax=Eumeta variegata TaxID=151549 RepID=A0A4C1XGW1_EUMVA|nr:hypothetical protein EVAR_50067_1 [Eumeta japonica]
MGLTGRDIQRVPTKLLFFSRVERGKDTSALTRLDDVSEQEFLKAPPSLPYCTQRTQRYFASIIRRLTHVIRGDTALYFRARLKKSTLLRVQRANDKLSRWFRT